MVTIPITSLLIKGRYLDKDLSKQIKEILFPQEPIKNNKYKIYWFRDIPYTKAIKAFLLIAEKHMLNNDIKTFVKTLEGEINDFENLKKYLTNLEDRINKQELKQQNLYAISIDLLTSSKSQIAYLNIYLESKDLF